MSTNEVKTLSRNPLTPWQRLVEINLDSMTSDKKTNNFFHAGNTRRFTEEKINFLKDKAKALEDDLNATKYKSALEVTLKTDVTVSKEHLEIPKTTSKNKDVFANDNKPKYLSDLTTSNVKEDAVFKKLESRMDIKCENLKKLDTISAKQQERRDTTQLSDVLCDKPGTEECVLYSDRTHKANNTHQNYASIQEGCQENSSARSDMTFDLVTTASAAKSAPSGRHDIFPTEHSSEQTHASNMDDSGVVTHTDWTQNGEHDMDTYGDGDGEFYTDRTQNGEHGLATDIDGEFYTDKAQNCEHDMDTDGDGEFKRDMTQNGEHGLATDIDGEFYTDIFSLQQEGESSDGDQPKGTGEATTQHSDVYQQQSRQLGQVTKDVHRHTEDGQCKPRCTDHHPDNAEQRRQHGLPCLLVEREIVVDEDNVSEKGHTSIVETNRNLTQASTTSWDITHVTKSNKTDQDVDTKTMKNKNSKQNIDGSMSGDGNRDEISIRTEHDTRCNNTDEVEKVVLYSPDRNKLPLLSSCLQANPQQAMIHLSSTSIDDSNTQHGDNRDRKQLTRDRLSDWKHLFDVNVESMFSNSQKTASYFRTHTKFNTLKPNLQIHQISNKITQDAEETSHSSLYKSRESSSENATKDLRIVSDDQLKLADSDIDFFVENSFSQQNITDSQLRFETIKRNPTNFCGTIRSAMDGACNKTSGKMNSSDLVNNDKAHKGKSNPPIQSVVSTEMCDDRVFETSKATSNLITAADKRETLHVSDAFNCNKQICDTKRAINDEESLTRDILKGSAFVLSQNSSFTETESEDSTEHTDDFSQNEIESGQINGSSCDQTLDEDFYTEEPDSVDVCGNLETSSVSNMSVLSPQLELDEMALSLNIVDNLNKLSYSMYLADCEKKTEVVVEIQSKQSNISHVTVPTHSIRSHVTPPTHSNISHMTVHTQQQDTEFEPAANSEHQNPVKVPTGSGSAGLVYGSLGDHVTDHVTRDTTYPYSASTADVPEHRGGSSHFGHISTPRGTHPGQQHDPNTPQTPYTTTAAGPFTVWGTELYLGNSSKPESTFKQLTRNKLSEWKHLVDVNIDSMIGKRSNPNKIILSKKSKTISLNQKRNCIDEYSSHLKTNKSGNPSVDISVLEKQGQLSEGHRAQCETPDQELYTDTQCTSSRTKQVIDISVNKYSYHDGKDEAGYSVHEDQANSFYHSVSRDACLFLETEVNKVDETTDLSNDLTSLDAEPNRSTGIDRRVPETDSSHAGFNVSEQAFGCSVQLHDGIESQGGDDMGNDTLSDTSSVTSDTDRCINESETEGQKSDTLYNNTTTTADLGTVSDDMYLVMDRVVGNTLTNSDLQGLMVDTRSDLQGLKEETNIEVSMGFGGEGKKDKAVNNELDETSFYDDHIQLDADTEIIKTNPDKPCDIYANPDKPCDVYNIEEDQSVVYPECDQGIELYWNIDGNLEHSIQRDNKNADCVLSGRAINSMTVGGLNTGRASSDSCTVSNSVDDQQVTDDLNNGLKNNVCNLSSTYVTRVEDIQKYHPNTCQLPTAQLESTLESLRSIYELSKADNSNLSEKQLKHLTRNRQTEWKHLVDVNLESMNGSRQNFNKTMMINRTKSYKINKIKQLNENSDSRCQDNTLFKQINAIKQFSRTAHVTTDEFSNQVNIEGTRESLTERNTSNSTDFRTHEMKDEYSIGDCLQTTTTESGIGDCLQTTTTESGIGDCLQTTTTESGIGDCLQTTTESGIDGCFNNTSDETMTTNDITNYTMTSLFSASKEKASLLIQKPLENTELVKAGVLGTQKSIHSLNVLDNETITRQINTPIPRNLSSRENKMADLQDIEVSGDDTLTDTNSFTSEMEGESTSDSEGEGQTRGTTGSNNFYSNMADFCRNKASGEDSSTLNQKTNVSDLNILVCRPAEADVFDLNGVHDTSSERIGDGSILQPLKLTTKPNEAVSSADVSESSTSVLQHTDGVVVADQSRTQKYESCLEDQHKSKTEHTDYDELDLSDSLNTLDQSDVVNLPVYHPQSSDQTDSFSNRVISSTNTDASTKNNFSNILNEFFNTADYSFSSKNSQLSPIFTANKKHIFLLSNYIRENGPKIVSNDANTLDNKCKQLTRNRSTEWKHLVDVNIESMADHRSNSGKIVGAGETLTTSHSEKSDFVIKQRKETNKENLQADDFSLSRITRSPVACDLKHDKRVTNVSLFVDKYSYFRDMGEVGDSIFGPQSGYLSHMTLQETNQGVEFGFKNSVQEAVSKSQQSARANGQQVKARSSQPPVVTSGSQHPLVVASDSQQPMTSDSQQPMAVSSQQSMASSTQQPLASGNQQPTANGSLQPMTNGTQQPMASGSQQPMSTSSQQPTASCSQQPMASSSQHPLVVASDSQHPVTKRFWSLYSDSFKTQIKKSDEFTQLKKHTHSKVFSLRTGKRLAINDDTCSDKTVSKLFSTRKIFGPSPTKGNILLTAIQHTPEMQMYLVGLSESKSQPEQRSIGNVSLVSDDGTRIDKMSSYDVSDSKINSATSSSWSWLSNFMSKLQVGGRENETGLMNPQNRKSSTSVKEISNVARDRPQVNTEHGRNSQTTKVEISGRRAKRTFPVEQESSISASLSDSYDVSTDFDAPHNKRRSVPYNNPQLHVHGSSGKPTLQRRKLRHRRKLRRKRRQRVRTENPQISGDSVSSSTDQQKTDLSGSKCQNSFLTNVLVTSVETNQNLVKSEGFHRKLNVEKDLVALKNEPLEKQLSDRVNSKTVSKRSLNRKVSEVIFPGIDIVDLKVTINNNINKDFSHTALKPRGQVLEYVSFAREGGDVSVKDYGNIWRQPLTSYERPKVTLLSQTWPMVFQASTDMQAPPQHMAQAHTSRTPHHTTQAHTSKTPQHMTQAHTSRTPHHTTQAHTSKTPQHMTQAHTSKTPQHMTQAHMSKTPQHMNQAHTSKTPQHMTQAHTSKTPQHMTQAHASKTPQHSTQGHASDRKDKFLCPTQDSASPSTYIEQDGVVSSQSEMLSDSCPSDSNTSDALMQSSLECLLEMLLQRGKVKHAFVASMEGNVLAATAGLEVTGHDVMTLGYTLKSNYSGVVKITLLSAVYNCFVHDKGLSLIGRADNSVFAARKRSEIIVVGFTDPSTPGSCIKEVQELSEVLSQRGL